MPHELSDEDKAVFKAATERRKANAIKLGRFAVMADTNQVISLDEFFNGWVERLGKQRAVDYLIVCMRRGDEALVRALEEREKKGRKKND